MLDLGANTRLATVRGLVRFGQGPVAVRAFIGEVFGPWGNSLEPFPPRLATIGAIPIKPSFVSIEQIRDFVSVGDVGRRHAGVMNQATAATFLFDH
jgi:nucleoside-diphosphate-sugar epimerase